jgi:hypothetical protein
VDFPIPQISFWCVLQKMGSRARRRALSRHGPRGECRMPAGPGAGRSTLYRPSQAVYPVPPSSGLPCTALPVPPSSGLPCTAPPKRSTLYRPPSAALPTRLPCTAPPNPSTLYRSSQPVYPVPSLPVPPSQPVYPVPLLKRSTLYRRILRLSVLSFSKLKPALVNSTLNSVLDRFLSQNLCSQHPLPLSTLAEYY